MMSRTTDSGTPAFLSHDVVLWRRLWNESSLTVRFTECPLPLFLSFALASANPALTSSSWNCADSRRDSPSASSLSALAFGKTGASEARGGNFLR